MQHSEILVVFDEDLLHSGLERIQRIEGLRIELVYPLSRRAVTVLRTETGEQQLRRLRMIRALPQVFSADVRPGYRRPEDAPSAPSQQAGRYLEPV